MAKLGDFDGQQYFVPWDWGYESILVRTDKVDQVPASWADLWNPEYAGRLSVPDSAEVVFVMAALAAGIPDPWNTTPEQDEADQAKADRTQAQRPHLLGRFHRAQPDD